MCLNPCHRDRMGRIEIPSVCIHQFERAEWMNDSNWIEMEPILNSNAFYDTMPIIKLIWIQLSSLHSNEKKIIKNQFMLVHGSWLVYYHIFLLFNILFSHLFCALLTGHNISLSVCQLINYLYDAGTMSKTKIFHSVRSKTRIFLPLICSTNHCNWY